MIALYLLAFYLLTSYPRSLLTRGQEDSYSSPPR